MKWLLAIGLTALSAIALDAACTVDVCPDCRPTVDIYPCVEIIVDPASDGGLLAYRNCKDAGR